MRLLAGALALLAVLPVEADEATYSVTEGDLPQAHASNGYVQQVRPRLAGGVVVHVATALTPIGAYARYRDLAMRPPAGIPLGFQLPERLTELADPSASAWQVATTILEWASDHVTVDVSDTSPQDAVSVLARGYGRCSGLANVATALLLAAGFEARTVSGVLVGRDGGAIPHRWLECRLPEAGWVASDPTLGLWTVTSRHLVFADTVDAMPSIEIVAAAGDGLRRLPTRGGRKVRPNVGANLVCRLPHAALEPFPVAVLRGEDGETRRSRLDPEARFAGLLPGRWVLEVETANGIVERRELVLRAGDVQVYTVQSIATRGRRGSES